MARFFAVEARDWFVWHNWRGLSRQWLGRGVRPCSPRCKKGGFRQGHSCTLQELLLTAFSYVDLAALCVNSKAAISQLLVGFYINQEAIDLFLQGDYELIKQVSLQVLCRDLASSCEL